MRGDDAIDYPEHLARDQRTAGEEKTQQVWKAEHPLALIEKSTGARTSVPYTA